MGEFAAAQATAEAIDVEEDRTEALTKLASAQAHAGDSEAARASFAAAQATAEAIALDRENVFGGPAITQAKKALESVSASLSETVDRAELKQVIGACTDFVDLAPRICALLARAYPDQAAGLVARVQPLLSSA